MKTNFSIEWLRDTLDSQSEPIEPDRLRYACQQLSYAAVGTFVDATVTAEGEAIDILRVASKMGRGCNLRDERGVIVWAGRLHELTVTDGRFEHTLSMEEFGNNLSVVYYQVDSQSVDIGKRTRSDWASDAVSVARYGAHQHIITRNRMTATEAAAELQRVLADNKSPAYTVLPPTGGSPSQKRLTAQLSLKGQWYYLQRVYFQDLSNVVQSSASSDSGQNFGEGSGIQDVCCPFTALANGDEFRSFWADTVVLKVHKVVDGWGAAAQPTDSLIVDIIADAPLGVYIGDVVVYGTHGADLWTLTGPVALKDAGGNSRQDGAPVSDQNWRGLWLGAKADVMIGRPWYGQTDVMGYPVNWERRVADNTFEVAEIPTLTVTEWPIAGAGPTDGGWDSSGSGPSYRVGSRFQLLPGSQSTQQVIGAPLSVPGPDFGADGNTPNIVASSDLVPASRIGTTSAEVSFKFATPFLVSGARLWIRVRRTEGHTNPSEYHWRGKGYYVLGCARLKQAAEASLLTRVWRSDLKHWKCAIPTNLRDTAGGQSAAPLPVALWFKVTGTRETSEQLRQMVASRIDRIERLIVDGPRMENGVPKHGSGVFTIPYRNGDRTVMDEMTALLERGDAGGKRMTLAMVPRTAQNGLSHSLAALRFEPTKTSPVVFHRDGSLSRDGVPQDTLPPPVGEWIQSDTVIGIDETGRAPLFFCEEATWMPDSGLDLRPRRAPRFGQLPDDEEQM